MGGVISPYSGAWLYPSGDASGNKDLATVNQAIAALNGKPGRIPLGAGTWYLPPVPAITRSGVYIDGAGQWATLIKGVGSGDVFRMYDPLPLGSRTVQGGGFRGLTIDVSGMTAASSSSGVHVGDIFNLQMDLGVTGAALVGTSAKNIWLDNQYLYTEQMRGELYSQNGPVVFDNSANLGSATGSFDRAELMIRVETGGLSDAVVWQNGAFIVNGSLSIQGNANYSSSTAYAIMRFLGANSSLANLLLNVGVELDGSGSLSPYTINLAVASNTITQCTGILDFGAGTSNMTNCNNPQQVAFWGPVRGDTSISAMEWAGSNSQAITANGQTIFAYPFGRVRCANSGTSYTGLILSAGSIAGQRVTLVNVGAGTLTFAAAGTSNVADGVTGVIAANTERILEWDTTSALWYRVN